MPVLLSCKSATALDSLPRLKNVKRSSSALHRLQQRKQAAHANSEGEADILASNPHSERLPRKSFNALRHKKSSQGLSSADLPLASSDLYHEELATSPVLLQSRDTFSEDEHAASSDEEDNDDKKHNRFVKGMRSQSFSPSKANRLSRFIAHIDNRPSSPTPLFPPASHHATARKRVVTTTMIGKPTNFKHTGHLGATSYNAMQKEALEKQLLEVTAALQTDGDGEDGAVVVRDQFPSQRSSISEVSLATTTSGENSSIHLHSTPMSLITSTPASMSAQIGLPTFPSSPTQRPALLRQSSKRKPVPKTRELADLCDIFKDQVLEEDEATQDVKPVRIDKTLLPIIPAETRTVKDEEHIPTLRAHSGRNLVVGPAGDLITDTANGRWVGALDEIKQALKAEGGDDQHGEGEDIGDGLKRADAILAQLDAL